MRHIKKILLLAVLLSQNVYAVDPDCTVYTEARKLALDRTSIKFDILNEKTGEYRAILKNGDLLFASFAQCSLGTDAHFYSRTAITKEQRANTMRWFLKSILTSYSFKKYGKQVKSSIHYLDNKVYKVADDYEGHYLEFKPAESPLFKTALHYTWMPPEH